MRSKTLLILVVSFSIGILAVIFGYNLLAPYMCPTNYKDLPGDLRQVEPSLPIPIIKNVSLLWFNLFPNPSGINQTMLTAYYEYNHKILHISATPYLPINFSKKAPPNYKKVAENIYKEKNNSLLIKIIGNRSIYLRPNSSINNLSFAQGIKLLNNVKGFRESFPLPPIQVKIPSGFQYYSLGVFRKDGDKYILSYRDDVNNPSIIIIIYDKGVVNSTYRMQSFYGDIDKEEIIDNSTRILFSEFLPSEDYQQWMLHKVCSELGKEVIVEVTSKKCGSEITHRIAKSSRC